MTWDDVLYIQLVLQSFDAMKSITRVIKQGRWMKLALPLDISSVRMKLNDRIRYGTLSESYENVQEMERLRPPSTHETSYETLQNNNSTGIETFEGVIHETGKTGLLSPQEEAKLL